MEYVRIPEIISAFSGRDSSRVRHLAIFYQKDQLLPVTHSTSVDNPIAIAHPLLSPYYKMKKGDRTSSTTSTPLYGMKS